MKKGDVCIVDLSTSAGHEQSGERPAILISDTKTDIAIVVPLTGNLDALRFPYVLMILPSKNNQLDKESVALIFHIRAIDKTRIVKTIGKIDKSVQNKIDSVLKELLRL